MVKATLGKAVVDFHGFKGMDFISAGQVTLFTKSVLTSFIKLMLFLISVRLLPFLY